MTRTLARCLVAALALALVTTATAAPAHKKKHVGKHWHGYGFLPGYRPPEVIERDRAEHYDRLYGQHYYGPAWPRFYRGRWNGGGFGPCYVLTPIGYMWDLRAIAGAAP